MFLLTRWIESDWCVWCWCEIVWRCCSKKRFNILPPLVFSPTRPDPPPTTCRVPWRLCLSWAVASLVSPTEATPLLCPSLWWTSRWDSTWIWPYCRVSHTQRSCDNLVLHPRLVFLGFEMFKCSLLDVLFISKQRCLYFVPKINNFILYCTFILYFKSFIEIFLHIAMITLW